MRRLSLARLGAWLGGAAVVAGTLAFTAAPASAAASDDGRGLWGAAARPSAETIGDHTVDITTTTARTLTLDARGMGGLLAKAPDEASAAARTSATVISLPSPAGGFERFAIVDTPLMAPELGARYPEITTYVGQGIDDPTATVRLDQGPNGFHAQVLSPKGTWYIDPLFRQDSSVYVSYFRTDLVDSHEAWTEGELPGGVEAAGARVGTSAGRIAGDKLRTYRLAITATVEYSAKFGATKLLVLAEIVRAVNRVTGIYEVELAARFQLIANNDALVFLAEPDGITNNDTNLAIDENQTVTDAKIGDANYDVGHVFTTSAGGLAGLGVIGKSGQKAQGVTGLSNPTGDAYWVDYVAHELGHQFGGNHTFSGTIGNCAGNISDASMEPGSGSTIQAYAGICGADDLQNRSPNASSDPYFHAKSFDEMQAVMASPGQGGTTSATGNSIPTVSTVGGAAFAIPPQTPFALTAAGVDANGDSLTYGWEQYDATPSGRALGTQPKPNGALFRSFIPTANPTRYFPSLANIAAGTTNIATGSCPALPGGLACLSEYLPTTARTMNFRGTVRDNRAGGGGVSNTDVVVTVAGATPFAATGPVGVSFAGGSAQTITWNAAGTTGAPYNATNVDIFISTDGGLTFPKRLISATPNDGSQSVILPNTPTGTARVMVRANPGIFFSVTNANFTITPGVTPAVPSAPGTPTAVASGNSQATVTFAGSASEGGAPITGYTVTASPGGKTCSTAAPPSCVVTALTAGNYTFTVAAENVGGFSPASAPSAAISVGGPATAPSFTPLVPARLMETRAGLATVDGQSNNLGVRAAGTTTELQVAGRGNVPADAGAVVLNVTVTEPDAAGFLTVFPCGATQPNASSLNYNRGQTVPNAVVTKLGTGGKVCFFTQQTTHLVVDVTGQFSVSSSYASLVPARLLESRGGLATVDGQSNNLGVRPATSVTELVVNGRGGVDGGAASVVLNVTVTEPDASGFVTVFPCGTDRPNASSLNFTAGQTVPNAVISKVGAGGKVCFYTTANTHLVVDVTGYFPLASTFTSVVPARLLESRGGLATVDGQSNNIGIRPGDTVTELVVTGRGNVPANATAVVLNVTVTEPTDSGFVTVFPCGSDRPNASSLNYVVGQTVPNAVIAGVGAGGKVCLYSKATTHLVADVTGYFVAG